MVEGNPSNLGTTCYETATQNHRWIHPRIIVAMNIPFKNVQNQSMNTLIYFELPIRVYQVCCIHWPFVVVKYPKSKNVGKIRHLLVFLHSYCWGKSGFTATNAPVSPFVHCQIYNFYQFLDDQPKKRLPTPCFNFKSTIFHGHLPIVSTHPFRLTKKHTDRSIAVRCRDPRIRWVWINTYENTIFRGLFTSINPSYDLMWTTGDSMGFDTLPGLQTLLVESILRSLSQIWWHWPEDTRAKHGCDVFWVDTPGKMRKPWGIMGNILYVDF